MTASYGENWTQEVEFSDTGAMPGVRVINALRGDEGQVGRLDYEVHGDGDIEVMHLEVPTEFSRQGVASALMGELERLYPGRAIDHGCRTPEGEQWAAAYYGTQVTERPDISHCTSGLTEPDMEFGWHPEADENDCPVHRPVRAESTVSPS